MSVTADKEVGSHCRILFAVLHISDFPWSLVLFLHILNKIHIHYIGDIFDIKAGAI